MINNCKHFSELLLFLMNGAETKINLERGVVNEAQISAHPCLT